MKTTEGPSGNLFLQRPFLIIILVSMQRQESILDTELTQNVAELLEKMFHLTSQRKEEGLYELKMKLNNMTRSFISSLEVFGKIQLTEQGRSTISDNRKPIYSLNQSQMEKIGENPNQKIPSFNNFIQRIVSAGSKAPTTAGKSSVKQDFQEDYISIPLVGATHPAQIEKDNAIQGEIKGKNQKEQSKFPFPCKWGCNRPNVVSKVGNSCGRPSCNEAWNKNHK